MEKLTAWRKTTEDGKSFYYVDFGKETHGRKSFRLWVRSELLEFNEKFEFGGFLYLPCQGVDIVKTEKGTLILTKGEFNLFNVFTRCGYRGESKIEVLTQAKLVLPYLVYHSERGSLGVSAGALVLTKENSVRWRWHRTGRLYGAPKKGVSIVNLNGEVKDFEDIEDLRDLQELEEGVR